MSSPIARSTLTGSSSAVQCHRRTRRPKWVSTVIPGTSNALPKIDVGGLATHTGQRHELFHGARKFAVEALDQGLTEANQRRRFIVKKTGRANKCFEFFAVGLRIVHRGPVTDEQRGGGEIHPLVRALRRQDRCHRQLQRRGEIQLAVRVGKRLRQFTIHPCAPDAPSRFGSPMRSGGQRPRRGRLSLWRPWRWHEKVCPLSPRQSTNS